MCGFTVKLILGGGRTGERHIKHQKNIIIIVIEVVATFFAVFIDFREFLFWFIIIDRMNNNYVWKN